MMISVKTKEHLVYLMQSGVMRLSKYDLRFVQNLQTISLNKKSVTSNQVILFDKLIDKYRRQLIKQGYTLKFLQGLPWESTIIDSDPQYTEAYINIVDGKLFFKGPFNKRFVEKINKEFYKPFIWSKDEKVYTADFSTYALKFVVEMAHNFYAKVNYCPTTELVINKLQEYNATYWSPTLVRSNNRLLVAAINTNLFDSIKDIDLSLDSKTLSLLSSYGIKIDDSLINNDPILNFASNYIVEVDFQNLSNVVDYLREIETDIVFILGSGVSQVNVKKILTNRIMEAGITVDDKPKILLEEKLKDKMNPVVISLSSDISHIPSFFNKIIVMKNSTPITLK